MEHTMIKPIRILQVFYSMYPGGAESIIMNLYRCIDKSQVQFDFIVHTEETEFYDKEIVEMGGQIFRVPKYTGRNHWTYVNAWHSFFSSHPEYRIIHAHIRSTASIYLKVAKNYGLTTIIHSHSTSEGSGVQAFIKRALELPLKRTADYLFACSDEAGKWLFGKKIGKNPNYHILKNAVDTKKFRFNEGKRTQIRIELGIKNEIVIGHVGRFLEMKNHIFIVRVFHEYLKYADAKLILVGTGKLMYQTKKECERLDITNKVYFLGNRTDVDAIMSAMDVFLMPSLYEGLPVVLVEAQASGLPCLVTNDITKEVDVANLHRLDLAENISIWTETLLKLSNKKTDRSMSAASVKNSGFDIWENVRWLQNFYQGIT